MPEKLVLSWSGGKDSCMALSELLKERQQVVALLTTITRDYDRVSMHWVRRALIERQAEELGLPIRLITISKGAGNEEYESRMKETLADFRDDGVDVVAFGDLFLEDIKAYRDGFLDRIGMVGCYPIWKRDTTALIAEFIDSGFKAVVSCVSVQRLDASFVGRVIDRSFLAGLPSNVDPCGENGEFHTFVFGGPIFRSEVRYTTGEIVLRDGHYYCDLLPE